MQASPGEIATVILVLAIVIERLLERRDRRRETALRDAKSAGDLKEDYIQALEGRVERLELELGQERAKNAVMRTALRWFFDELAASDRCLRATSGCPNRLAPGAGFSEDRMAQIRELLEDPEDPGVSD